MNDKKIPRIINYCWFGGKPLPLEVKKCIKSWKKYCPDYEIKQWNESNVDITCHVFMKKAYDVKAWAFVSDYARLKVIYENGGIYLDTDVELIKSLESLRDNQCYIGVAQGSHLCNTGLGFGALKSSPFVQKMMEEYDNLEYQDDKKKEMACPKLNHKVIEAMGYQYSEQPVNLNGVLVLPPRFLDPFSPGADGEKLLCNDTISIHHYSASWHGKNARFRRKIVRVIGQERTEKIKDILYHR